MGRKNNGDGGQEAPFNMGELQRALNRVGKTASGKDQVCYIMLKYLSLDSQEKLLMLYKTECGRREGYQKVAKRQ